VEASDLIPQVGKQVLYTYITYITIQYKQFLTRSSKNVADRKTSLMLLLKSPEIIP